jgi:SAM-dependent methyltransferase
MREPDRTRIDCDAPSAPSETRIAFVPSKTPPSPSVIIDALHAGRMVTDTDFDACIPNDLGQLSSQFWTPLAVVMRAAQWIEELGIRTVVDIGSGAGKFCVAAALVGRARYIGIEQRPHLVEAARSLACAFGVEDRVSFHVGVLGEHDIPDADAYYFYNPFGENLFGGIDKIDGEVELSTRRYFSDVGAAETLLARAPVGTALLTYNGFGGKIPRAYESVRLDRTVPNVLRMWRKVDLKPR